MDRNQFRLLRQSARRANEARRATINGRAWSIGRDGVQRLAADGSWTFDRPQAANIAMVLGLTAHMRRRFGITQASSLRALRTIRLEA